MAFETYTVDGNLLDVLGVGAPSGPSQLRRITAYAEPSQPVISDTDTNQQRFGNVVIPVMEDGAFEVDLVGTGEDSLAGWTIVVEWRDSSPAATKVTTTRFGPFPLTEDRTFAEILADGFLALVPVTIETLETVYAARDEAQAAAATATQLATSDGQTAFNVENGPLTAAALSATFEQQAPDIIADQLADNPDIAAEAALLAQSDAGLVLKTDPGAPVSVAYELNEQILPRAEIDVAGRSPSLDLPDGTVYQSRHKADIITTPDGKTQLEPLLEYDGKLYEKSELDTSGGLTYGRRPDGGHFIGRFAFGRLESQWTGKKVLVVGTSITEGYNATNVGGVRQGFIVKAIRDAHGALLDNQGVASSRIMWLGNNALSLGATQAELTGAGYDPAQSYEVKVLGKNADLYIFDHGYNDRSGTLGTITDTNPNTFYGAFNRVIGALLTEKPSAQIAFITPPSLYSPVGGGLNAGTAEKRTAIFALGEKYCAPVLDLSIRAGMNATQAGTFLPDTVHPSQEAHDRMARQLDHFLRGI